MLRFEQISVTVPVNAPDPVGWAKGLAGRSLKLHGQGAERQLHFQGEGENIQASNPPHHGPDAPAHDPRLRSSPTTVAVGEVSRGERNPRNAVVSLRTA